MTYTIPKEGEHCQDCPLFEVGIPVFDHVPEMGEEIGLVLLGEGPGEQEVKFQRPFCGASGELLWPTLNLTIPESKKKVYATNCVRCGLRRGTKPADGVMRKAIECCMPAVLENIKEWGATTVCAVGAIPLEALTGQKGIDKYRGTVIPPTKKHPFFRTSTLHPAGLLRIESRRILWNLLHADLGKAARLAMGDIDLWEPDVRDTMDLEGALELLEKVQRERLPLAIDVETTVDTDDIYNLSLQSELMTIGVGAFVGATNGEGEIPSCYSLLYPQVFPDVYRKPKPRKLWRKIERKLKELLGDPNQKVVFHNFSFDVPVLSRGLDVEVECDIHDTLLLHHAVYPKLPKKLQQVASQFLAVEAWKDDFRKTEKELVTLVDKSERELARMLHNPITDVDEEDEEAMDAAAAVRERIADLTKQQIEEGLWYNALDVGSTIMIFNAVMREAAELDVMKVYDHDRELMRETLHWTERGIKVDMLLRAQLSEEYREQADSMHARLLELCLLPEHDEIFRKIHAVAAKIGDLEANRKRVRQCCAVCGEGQASGPLLVTHLKNKHPAEFAEAVKYRDGLLEYIEQQIAEKKIKLKALRKTTTNKTFNPASPDQLREVFAARGIRPTKLTKKSGQISTAKDALWNYRDDVFIDTLCSWRAKSKLLSTYLVNLPRRLGPDGAIHPVWKLHATPSGRFGTQPAVQNWPAEMKRMMIARPGYVIVGADYGALELRISALLAGQSDLIERFNKNEDIHALHASWFFPKEWETAVAQGDAVRVKSLRTNAKPVTFGKIYRAGDHTLYENIREDRLDVITRNQHRMLEREVSHMSRVLDQKYPNMMKSAKLFEQQATRDMLLRTSVLGRIRRWPMAMIPPGVSLNEACNHPIQGMAADLMNAATLRLAGELRRRGWYREAAFIILQVHDALYLEVRKAIAEEVRQLLEQCMVTKITHRSHVTGEENTMIFPAEAKIAYNVKDAA